jgi:hypothetical protein
MMSSSYFEVLELLSEFNNGFLAPLAKLLFLDLFLNPSTSIVKSTLGYDLFGEGFLSLKLFLGFFGRMARSSNY